MSLGWDRWQRRRESIINAIAIRYKVLISPELLEELLNLDDDPVEAVGEVLQHLPECPAVLTLNHLKVMA